MSVTLNGFQEIVFLYCPEVRDPSQSMLLCSFLQFLDTFYSKFFMKILHSFRTNPRYLHEFMKLLRYLFFQIFVKSKFARIKIFVDLTGDRFSNPRNFLQSLIIRNFFYIFGDA